jgi:hypothetical protein
MKTPEQIKIEENLRFQIERIFWKFEIYNNTKLQSFTVTLDKGSVKSVRAKFSEE